jgi:hypothetical protein
MSTINKLQLDRDFPDGFFGFCDAAEKKYGSKIYDAIESCKEKAWKVTKEIFLNNPKLPLLRDVAVALEKTILQLS